MNTTAKKYDAVRGTDINALVTEHAPLVKRIALHLAARLPDHVQLDDLIQAGLLGLLEAAQNFEEGHGAAFSTFAGTRIRGAMWDEVRRMDWTPRSVHRNLREASDTIRRIENRTGRHARDGEIAAEMGLDATGYAALMRDASATRLMSLEETNDNNPNAGPIDDSNPAHNFEYDEIRGRLKAALTRLPERDQQLLALYYIEELNMKEIGAVFGVGESRVSQLRGRALLRLRAYLSE